MHGPMNVKFEKLALWLILNLIKQVPVTWGFRRKADEICSL